MNATNHVLELQDVFEKVMKHTYFLNESLDEIVLDSVNQRDWTGDSPLHVVTRLGCIEDAITLIRNGAEVNATGERNMTPLHYAAMKGNAELVGVLLLHGASPKAVDDDGKQPIDWALSAGHVKVVSKLKAQPKGK